MSTPSIPPGSSVPLSSSSPSLPLQEIPKIVSQVEEKVTSAFFAFSKVKEEIQNENKPVKINTLKLMDRNIQLLKEAKQSHAKSVFIGMGKLCASVLGSIAYAPFFAIGFMVYIVSDSPAKLIESMIDPYKKLFKYAEEGKIKVLYGFKSNKKIDQDIESKNKELNSVKEKTAEEKKVCEAKEEELIKIIGEYALNMKVLNSSIEEANKAVNDGLPKMFGMNVSLNFDPALDKRIKDLKYKFEDIKRFNKVYLSKIHDLNHVLDLCDKMVK